MNNSIKSNSIERDQFDFEIGYLIKSPCLKCDDKKDLPQCHTQCVVLDQIQTRLARAISSQASSYRN